MCPAARFNGGRRSHGPLEARSRAQRWAAGDVLMEASPHKKPAILARIPHGEHVLASHGSSAAQQRG